MSCAHVWIERPRRPGTFRCSECGTRYPCAGSCEHIDCRMDKGDPRPPPGVVYVLCDGPCAHPDCIKERHLGGPRTQPTIDADEMDAIEPHDEAEFERDWGDL